MVKLNPAVAIFKYQAPRTNLVVGNPYLWLRFHDSSGTTLADSSGNGRNQTISGTITNFWKTGKIGSCGYFQAAATNKVSMPGNYFPINGTWCCWIKTEWSTLPTGNSRFFNTDDSRGTNYEHISSYSGVLYWVVANGSTSSYPNIGVLSSYDNQWIHICWTWNYDGANTNVRGYLNGSNVSGSNKTISGTLIVPNVSVDIGFWNGYFNGYIEDFLLYDSTLTDEQIALIYEFQS